MTIQSAWLSKINWTQAIAFIFGALTYFGFTVPPNIQDAALAAIIAISTIVTWLFRTFATKTITPAMAARL